VGAPEVVVRMQATAEKPDGTNRKC